MRKTIIIISAAVITALVVTGVTVAEAQGPSPTGHPGRPHAQTFTVVERAITDTVTDTGAKGDTVGDILTFANPVFDKGNRHRVGSDNGSCIRTVAAKAYECSWTTTLAGGSLVVEGPFYDTADSTLAITGGTGIWARAHGQMRLHARDAAGSSYDFVFTVER